MLNERKAEDKTMTVNELAHEIHANAVNHGWWDGEHKPAEIIALFHSEWSEALEEARAGRPLVWYAPDDNLGCCYMTKCGGNIISERCCTGAAAPQTIACPARKKPEGIAVEIIDGCIRILDSFDFFKVTFNDEETLENLMHEAQEYASDSIVDIATVVSYLHFETSMLFQVIMLREKYGLEPATFLIGALGIALAWVKNQGLDPLAILLEKHEYNKTRPYKHGKKF